MNWSRGRTSALAATTILGVSATLVLGPPSPETAAAATGPTSAEDCKGGEWRTFTDPGFKNQGQCVSYVNAMGRAKPEPTAGPDTGAPGTGGQSGTAGRPGNGRTDPPGTTGSGAQGRGGTVADPAPTPGGAPSVPPAADEAAQPVAGESAVAATASGTVTVKEPGATGFVALESGAVPLGATVDASAGTVEVTTALPGGEQQSVTLWGGRFRLRQRAGGKVDIRLPGVNTDACDAPAADPVASASSRPLASAARKRSKQRLTSLWAKDHRGRYSTSGRNSVATVRGTVWVTRERCDGTFTYVRRGRVDVVDRATGERTVVRAGRGHLAEN